MLACSGCGYSVTEGECYYKEFEPEKYTEIIMPIVSVNTTMMLPMNQYTPSRWIVYIREFSKSKKQVFN